MACAVHPVFKLKALLWRSIAGGISSNPVVLAALSGKQSTRVDEGQVLRSHALVSLNSAT